MGVDCNNANLKYYREPRKIGPCVAGYIPELAQYNLLLEYKPGATNRADALSRRPDYEVEGNPDNEDITVLLDNLFCITHTTIHVFCYDPPPFFSSPSTTTYTPAAPAPTPSAVPAPSAPPQPVPTPPAPPQHVHHPTAAPAPIHPRHHSPQPMEDQRAEPQLAETEPGPRPVLPQLDTEALQ